VYMHKSEKYYEKRSIFFSLLKGARFPFFFYPEKLSF
jgi:hypothetical protein